MVMTKSLTHRNTVACKEGNFTLHMLLSSKIILMQSARLNHCDAKPFKAQTIATQQVKVITTKGDVQMV